MNPCDDCRVLIGAPSCSPPHANLNRSGVGMWGGLGPGGRQEVKAYDQFRCAECGTWMYQCTENDDEAPGYWRKGVRPSDWPEEESTSTP